MPHAVVLLAMGRSASFVARWILCLHALRTYLTPINKQVRKWRRSFYADPVPDVVQDVQKWLSQATEDVS